MNTIRALYKEYSAYLGPTVVFFKILVFLGLAVSLFHLLQKPVNMANADLGRHLKNGEIILHGLDNQGLSLFRQNYFSYTEPEHGFVLHHWGGGVLLYLAYLVGGITGAQYLYIIMVLLAFALCFDVARRLGGFWPAVLASIPLMPMIGDRVEVRPEGFSVFFLSVVLWVLTLHAQKKLQDIWLWVLPILLLIWVNTHIYFIFGLGLTIFYCALQYFFVKKSKYLIHISIASLVACCISPFGPTALLFPLQIFQSYGYTIVENKSVFFLARLGMWRPIYTVTVAALSLVGAFVLGSGVAWLKKQVRPSTYNFFLFTVALGMSGVALMAIRNISQAGLMLLPVCAIMVAYAASKVKYVYAKVGAYIVCVALLFNVTSTTFADRFEPSDLGPLPQTEAPIAFWKNMKLHGPIFNNYDIGSYLIFYLFPEEKVFVDGRPEAYSTDFLEKTYIDSQYDHERFKKLDEKEHFNAIIFNYRDLTNWGQDFLKHMIEDRDTWAVVYADYQVLIALKRNEENAPIITQYEFPHSAFGFH